MSDSNNWYYTDDTQVFGPFTFDAIIQMANAGLLNDTSLVAMEGGQTWQPLGEALVESSVQSETIVQPTDKMNQTASVPTIDSQNPGEPVHSENALNDPSRENEASNWEEYVWNQDDPAGENRNEAQKKSGGVEKNAVDTLIDFIFKLYDKAVASGIPQRFYAWILDRFENQRVAVTLAVMMVVLITASIFIMKKGARSRHESNGNHGEYVNIQDRDQNRPTSNSQSNSSNKSSGTDSENRQIKPLTIQEEFDVVEGKLGEAHLIHISQNLDFSNFPSLKNHGDNIYQFSFNNGSYGMPSLSGPAILITSEVSFSSTGEARLYINKVETISVKLKTGFTKDVDVYMETPLHVVKRYEFLRQKLLELEDSKKGEFSFPVKR